jgi:Ca2+-binding RTX toxin-like protein
LDLTISNGRSADHGGCAYKNRNTSPASYHRKQRPSSISDLQRNEVSLLSNLVIDPSERAMARIQVTVAEFPGIVLDGSGTDTLVLAGGGTFDFAYATVSGFSEIIIESGFDLYATVRVSGAQLASISSFGSETALGYSELQLTGSEIDLRGKTFNNIDEIYIDDDNATVTVSSLPLGLRLNALDRQGETIVLDGPVTTPVSRADLHGRGFDEIVEGSTTWTDAAPTLTGLDGHFYVREGESVRLDPEGDAIVADDGGPVTSLDIVLSGSGYYYPMDNFEIGKNFRILDNSFNQTLLYKGSVIGAIDDILYEDGARITFNQSATSAIINEFIQNLAYAPGDFVYYENVTITVTAHDKGLRKAEAVLHVTAEPNWTPTKPTLNGTSVAENATASTIVGTLKATDANGDPITYKLTDDAGGRFRIEGDKIVVSGNVPLDFEQAPKHTITVIANDGEKNGLPATFAISVTDILETFLGTKGKDKLSGTGGKDLLNGGLGSDTLTGGANKDIFVFDAKLGKANVDGITDFLPRQDEIHLENAIFKKLGKVGSLKAGAFYKGSVAHDRDDRIIYNKKTGTLSYDQDGTGAAKAVLFAKLSTKPDLKYTDFFVI